MQTTTPATALEDTQTSLFKLSRIMVFQLKPTGHTKPLLTEVSVEPHRAQAFALLTNPSSNTTLCQEPRTHSTSHVTTTEPPPRLQFFSNQDHWAPWCTSTLPSKPTEAEFTPSAPTSLRPSTESTTQSSLSVWMLTITTSSKTHGEPPGVTAGLVPSVQSTTVPSVLMSSSSAGDTNWLVALFFSCWDCWFSLREKLIILFQFIVFFVYFLFFYWFIFTHSVSLVHHLLFFFLTFTLFFEVSSCF